jgi:hypothetical protein
MKSTRGGHPRSLMCCLTAFEFQRKEGHPPTIINTNETTTDVIELIPDLPPQQVFDRLRQADNADGMSQRMKAFYLEEMHSRRIYQVSGHASTAHWAAEQLDMDERRARALVQIGAALLDHQELDAALLDGRLSWSKVAALAGIVMPHTQAKWIELAMTKNCAQLKVDVARARQGRNPSKGGGGSKGGLRGPRMQFHASFGCEKQEDLELIREEVMRELGKLVTDDEVLNWFVVHGMELVRARAEKEAGRESARVPCPGFPRSGSWDQTHSRSILVSRLSQRRRIAPCVS